MKAYLEIVNMEDLDVLTVSADPEEESCAELCGLECGGELP